MNVVQCPVNFDNSPAVEIQLSLNLSCSENKGVRAQCSGNLELLVRLRLNYLCFDSLNSELSE